MINCCGCATYIDRMGKIIVCLEICQNCVAGLLPRCAAWWLSGRTLDLRFTGRMLGVLHTRHSEQCINHSATKVGRTTLLSH